MINSFDPYSYRVPPKAQRTLGSTGPQSNLVSQCYAHLKEQVASYYCTLDVNEIAQQRAVLGEKAAFLLDAVQPHDVSKVLNPDQLLIYQLTCVDPQMPLSFGVDLHINSPFFPLVMAVQALVIFEEDPRFKIKFLTHFKEWIDVLVPRQTLDAHNVPMHQIPINFEFIHNNKHYCFVLNLESFIRCFQNAGIPSEFLKFCMQKIVHETGAPVQRGIENIGNSCYINSVLQALFSLPCVTTNLTVAYPKVFEEKIKALEGKKNAESDTPRKRYLQQLLDHAETLKPIHQQLTGIYDLLKAANEMRTSMIEFRRMLFESVSFLKGLNMWEQQDANDIINHLMAAAGYEVMLQQTTKGVHQVKKYESLSTPETLQVLSLPLRLKSDTDETVQNPILFTDLLYDFMNTHENDPYNAWRPQQGIEIREYNTERNITGTIPEVLSFQVKRFNFQGYGNKLQREIVFPKDDLIDMTPYLSEDLKSDKPSWYRLKSVVVHRGDRLSSGHYIAYGIRDKAWYFFNDGVCKEVSSDQVERAQAYLIFFEKVTENV